MTPYTEQQKNGDSVGLGYIAEVSLLDFAAELLQQQEEDASSRRKSSSIKK